MKKTYQILDLDCAHCAAKIEAAIQKLPGVQDATVAFLTQKMTIETESDDQSEVMKQVLQIVKKIEPDCEVLVK